MPSELFKKSINLIFSPEIGLDFKFEVDPSNESSKIDYLRGNRPIEFLRKDQSKFHGLARFKKSTFSGTNFFLLPSNRLNLSVLIHPPAYRPLIIGRPFLIATLL